MTLASNLSFSLPKTDKTEVACGSITIRKDELTLTLHCMFCELAYEEIKLFRSHLLHAHVVEIVGTKELLKDAKISSELKSWSKTKDIHCLTEESIEVDQGIEFLDEYFDFMDDDKDNEVSQDSISENTINEKLLESHKELPGVMIMNKEDVHKNADNKHLHLNTSAPSNTKVSARDLNELQTIRFIELLKEAVFLWDTKFASDCYNNIYSIAIKELTQKLKEELSSELDINESFVRAKIRQLKTIFRLESKNEDSGSLFSHLSFLEGHVSFKRSKCVICGEEIEDDNQQAHEKEHITDKTARKCRICNVYLPSKQYVVPHMTTHKIYICLLCNRDDFTTQASYKSHLAEVHPTKELLENVVKPKQSHTCEHCGDAAKVNFTSKSDLNRHIGATHPELRYVYNCTKCKERCKTRRKLKMHIQSLHSVADSPNEPTEYECEFCHHDSFLSQSELKLHVKLKHYDMIAVPKVVSPPLNWETSSHSVADSPNEPTEYECEFCYHAHFLSQTDLKLHIKLNHYDMPNVVSPPKNWETSSHSVADSSNEPSEYECEFCYHVPFLSQTDLKLHIKLEHYDIPPKVVLPPKKLKGRFDCKICEMSFSARYIRNAHIETEHNFKRKDTSFSLICEYCGKIFELPQALRRHRKIVHIWVGQHKCDVCDCAYSSVTRLRLHVNSVHRKEPTHVCDICSAGFYAKRYLNQHKVKNHKIKRPFQCKQCDSEFFVEHSLRYHKQKCKGKKL